MNPIASNHFLERLKERGIEESTIQNVLDLPDSVVYEDGLLVYQKVIEISSKLFLVRIFVNDLKIPPVLVTAHKTTKISKYLKQ